MRRRTTSMSFGGILGIIALTLASMAFWAAPAGATTLAKYWVSTTGTSNAPNSSCATAGYSSVQAAISAGEAYSSANAGVTAEVLVCPGTYYEQLTITSAITIESAVTATPATIELPGNASIGLQVTAGSTSCDEAYDTYYDAVDTNYDIVDICGSGTTPVTISHLNFNGNEAAFAATSLSCAPQYYGVSVRGAALTLTDSTVTGVGGDGGTSLGDQDQNGCQSGVAIDIGYEPTGASGKATLSGDTVSRYAKAGIVVDDTGSSASITTTAVTGTPPDLGVAQLGIQVSNGAYATIEHDTISGQTCQVAVCGPDPWSQTQGTAVLLYDESVPTLV